MRKMAVTFFLLLAFASANAKNCQNDAESLAKKKMPEECSKACALQVEEVTDVSNYKDDNGKPMVKKDEKLFRVNQVPAGRMFEVVVKATDCTIVGANEVGSTDD